MRTFLAGRASWPDETHIGMSGLRGTEKFAIHWLRRARPVCCVRLLPRMSPAWDMQSITDFAIASRPGPVWSGTLPGCFSPRFS